MSAEPVPARRGPEQTPYGGERGAAVDAVLFDYGGVLTTPVRDSIRGWMERDRIDPASFSAVLKAWLSRSAPEGTPIHRLETGELSIAEFDALLAAELRGVDGGPVPSSGLLAGLFADMAPDPAMFTLVADLQAAGVRTALLSNSWGNTYPRDRLQELFDPVVISGEVGMRKPNRDIFTHALDRLDLPAARVVFVDDAEPNTEGAAALGLRTWKHTDPATTRSALAELVPTLSMSAPTDKIGTRGTPETDNHHRKENA